ncbi:TonB-dependent receptor [Rapidithrix thailandica]|uniref:TonB-dependent receptor n=1 Tax=Rapidithrix thailandica TaxID=413964 RepID=A0AAW9SB17_9BACT
MAGSLLNTSRTVSLPLAVRVPSNLSLIVGIWLISWLPVAGKQLSRNALVRDKQHFERPGSEKHKGHIKGRLLQPGLSPIPYASIVLKGTGYGTSTDEQGFFSMAVPPGKYILIGSYIGFKTQEIPIMVNPNQTLNLGGIELAEATMQLGEVVVTDERELAYTASRTATPLKDLPVPVTIVRGKQLAQMGSRRLDEVLQEQTGLALTTDPTGASNGVGLQIQGFDADYTLIMIDGQPLLGRNASGILDLSRITVASIERIEIVKGTSSALYGSDALAGVVNIITKQKTTDRLQGVATLRYGTNHTLDATLDGRLPLPGKKSSLFFTSNFYRTDGFDTDASTPGKTLPPYDSYTLQGKIKHKFSKSSLLDLTARYSSRLQKNQLDMDQLGRNENQNRESDLNTALTLSNSLGTKADLHSHYYYTRYANRSLTKDLDNAQTLTEATSQQHLHRIESYLSYTVNATLQTMVGAGGNLEAANSNLYGGYRELQNGFAYLQADWKPVKRLGLLTGVRYDVHNIYGWQVSPRFGIRYTVSDLLTFKGSVGKGFKAPNFRQLYYSFNNMSAGYMIIGASVFQQEIQRIRQSGSQVQLNQAAGSINELQAERSTSFNFGASLTFSKDLQWESNVFYNTIRNMIFNPRVGKIDGRDLYSFSNIAKALTSGLETNLSWKIARGLELSLGYQLLYAKDRDILSAIKSGEGQIKIRTPEGKSRKARVKDYFNLANRSRHMANIKVFYEHFPTGIGLSLRANYRGRYGIDELNYSNGFIDPYDLYAKGYCLWNATVEKSFLQKKLKTQLICDNLTDYTDSLIPNQLGRRWMLSVSYQFQTNKPNKNKQ